MPRTYATEFPDFTTSETMKTIAAHAADFALNFMGFSPITDGAVYIHETSYDGRSYVTIAPLDRGPVVLTLDTPVIVTTVIDGDVDHDTMPTLRDALIDLYGASEGETLPAIFGGR
jgi:hypothetical protein